MNKYQKHIVCSYDYKLVCADKFSKPFNSYLGEDTVFICINSMIKENKYCTDILKKYFHRDFVMTKEDHKDFESSTKPWTYDYVYVKGDHKLKDNCHITQKQRGTYG